MFQFSNGIESSICDVVLWAELLLSTAHRHRGESQLSPLTVSKMAGNKTYTIVAYFGGDDGYRCGYCKNETGNHSNGKCAKYCELTRAVRHDMTEWLYANCLVPPAC